MRMGNRYCVGAVAAGLVLVCLTAGARAQAPVIEQVSPTQAYLEAGGAYVTLLVRGTGLEKITGYEVRREGAASTYLWVQTTPVENGRAGAVVLARADAPRDSAYALHVMTADGTGGPLPVRLMVVEPGDPRVLAESGATVGEAVTAAAGASSVVVSAEQIPRITSTRPDPLMVPATGVPTTLTLLGENLDGINEVRARRATQTTRYRGRQGVLPFRHVSGGLEVDVQASQKTLGQEYILDLMIGNYRAASVGFQIGDPQSMPPPEVAPVPPILPVRGRVIDLPAIKPLEEPTTGHNGTDGSGPPPPPVP